jgi:hypothetical protein
MFLSLIMKVQISLVNPKTLKKSLITNDKNMMTSDPLFTTVSLISILKLMKADTESKYTIVEKTISPTMTWHDSVVDLIR